MQNATEIMGYTLAQITVMESNARNVLSGVHYGDPRWSRMKVASLRLGSTTMLGFCKLWHSKYQQHLRK